MQLNLTRLWAFAGIVFCYGIEAWCADFTAGHSSFRQKDPSKLLDTLRERLQGTER